MPLPSGVTEGIVEPKRGRLREIAWVFLKLGFLAFGGPAAHTAMMEDELVKRRKWLSRDHFLDAVAAVQIVPGPNSTELAIHMGQLRGGMRGLLVAGVCFIGPAVLIILPIAIAYVQIGSLSPAARAGLETVMHTIAAAVLGVIAVAAWRLGRSAMTTPFTIVVGAFALAAALLIPGRFQPEIAILAIAGVAGVVAERIRSQTLAVSFALPLAVGGGGGGGGSGDWLRMAGFFLKVGGTLFGSGYVLVTYLESGLVDDLGWLSRQQVLDAIAIGQTTPGPLLTTSTFAGYLIGHEVFGTGILGSTLAGLVATGAMFLPSFVLVALFGPMLGRLRKSNWAKGMLSAMGAAAVGLIAAVALKLAGITLMTAGKLDVLNLAIAIVTVVLMVWRDLNATWLIGTAVIIGITRLAFQ